MFEDKSRPTNLRREISTKQNLCRDGLHHFFMKRHFSTTFFLKRHTSLPKKCSKTNPDQQISEEKSLPNKILAETFFYHIFFEETFFYHIFFEETHILTKKMFEDKSRPTNLRREISTKQNLCRDGLHHFFMKRHFSTTFFLKRHTSLPKKCSKTNPDQQISEEKSLPNKILAETFFYHIFFEETFFYHIFFEETHILTKKMFEDKSRPTNLRREISTKQNPCRDIFLPHFF